MTFINDFAHVALDDSITPAFTWQTYSAKAFSLFNVSLLNEIMNNPEKMSGRVNRAEAVTE